METKVCKICAQKLPLSEFSPNGHLTTGKKIYRTQCKACVNAKYKEIKRAGAQKFRDNHNLESKVIDYKYKQSHKEQIKARSAVQCALNSGKLLKPEACEKCGISNMPLEAHHEDYTKPLEVIFLCKLCHSKQGGK